MSLIQPTTLIHPTAIIQENVSIGEGTSIWDHVHIRKNVAIGKDCIIGEKTYIAYEVLIGNGVKINSFVYLCSGVTIEDHVMIAAGTTFTNDRLPRAFNAEDFSVKTSGPTEETMQAIVHRGVTIGANCTIGPGIDLGEYCMVGMGSVLTRSVDPFQLVYGNPARPQGFVCVCGTTLLSGDVEKAQDRLLACARCNRNYRLERKRLNLKS